MAGLIFTQDLLFSLNIEDSFCNWSHKNDFNFSFDQLREIFTLPHSVVLESYVKGLQFKVINSILYTNSELYKIGFKTDDL